MAKHDVSFTIPERDLGKADLEFKVKRDGEMIGRLKVSNGTLVWVPRNAQYGYSLHWAEFDGLMKSQGTSEKD